MFSTLTEFERDLIQERTQAGLKATRARKKMSGRPALLDTRQITRMIEMYDEQKLQWLRFPKFMTSASHHFINYLKQRKKGDQIINHLF